MGDHSNDIIAPRPATVAGPEHNLDAAMIGRRVRIISPVLDPEKVHTVPIGSVTGVHWYEPAKEWRYRVATLDHAGVYARVVEPID